MNRAQRRALLRSSLMVRWLVATKTCDKCGAPYCPSCGLEATVCECCGEDHCDACGAYVLPPVPTAELDL